MKEKYTACSKSPSSCVLVEEALLYTAFQGSRLNKTLTSLPYEELSWESTSIKGERKGY